MKRLFIYLGMLSLVATPVLAQGETGADSAQVASLDKGASIPLTLKTYPRRGVLPCRAGLPVLEQPGSGLHRQAGGHGPAGGLRR